MGYYSDPTGNLASGNLEREFKRMQKEADRLAALRQRGKLTAEDIITARRRFIGIYRPMLERVIGF